MSRATRGSSAPEEGPLVSSFTLRSARLEDAPDVLGIYAPYVRDTTISFEYAPPDLAAFGARMAGIMETHPYLVCEHGSQILAYAYASRHMERPAYAWDVQTSVYASPQSRGQGFGRALYVALFTLLRALGYYNAYAVITLPGQGSVEFHRSMGFTDAGVHHRSGYKFGAWHDVAWMEKPLLETGDPVAPPRRMNELDPAWVKGCLQAFSRAD